MKDGKLIDIWRVLVPKGAECYFSETDPCQLFQREADGQTICCGWGGRREVKDGKKHDKCLRAR